MLLNAFAQMPEYNFLWKFESETLPIALPNNVMIKKWLPQNDILAHSNIKGFITHAGALSTQEASWYGVPMICIPFFVDQFRVSQFSQSNRLYAFNRCVELRSEFLQIYEDWCWRTHSFRRIDH